MRGRDGQKEREDNKRIKHRWSVASLTEIKREGVLALASSPLTLGVPVVLRILLHHLHPESAQGSTKVNTPASTSLHT